MGKDTKSDSGLPPAFDDGRTYLVKGSTLNMLTTAVRKNKPIAGKGMKARQTDDGWVLDAEAEFEDEGHPYKVTVESGPGVIVQDAEFGSVTPTIYGEPLYDEPLLPITASGTEQVLMKVTFTLLKTEDLDRVVGATLVSAEIDIYSSIPSNDGSTGVFYVRLATLTDGVSSGSVRRTSLAWRICDDGSGDGVAQITLGPA